jgi:hypothetical protein
MVGDDIYVLMPWYIFIDDGRVEGEKGQTGDVMGSRICGCKDFLLHVALRLFQ